MWSVYGRPCCLGWIRACVHWVFWGECRVKVVLGFRTVFWFPPVWPSRCVSPSGCDAYNVWLNDAVMASGSNSRME